MQLGYYINVFNKGEEKMIEELKTPPFLR